MLVLTVRRYTNCHCPQVCWLHFLSMYEYTFKNRSTPLFQITNLLSKRGHSLKWDKKWEIREMRPQVNFGVKYIWELQIPWGNQCMTLWECQTRDIDFNRNPFNLFRLTFYQGYSTQTLLGTRFSGELYLYIYVYIYVCLFFIIILFYFKLNYLYTVYVLHYVYSTKGTKNFYFVVQPTVVQGQHPSIHHL